MYQLESILDEFTSIDELIDYVLENGIDPSETVYQMNLSGNWVNIGEVWDFMVE